MAGIDLAEDASENLQYGDLGIPIRIEEVSLAARPDMKELCCFHDDITWIFVKEGEMNYCVNGLSFLLKENDCLMVNARQLHFGYSNQQQNCKFLSVIFQPEILFGNVKLVEKYVYELTENGKAYYLFKSNSSNSKEFEVLLSQLFDIKSKKSYFKEMDLLAIFSEIWRRMLIMHTATNLGAGLDVDPKLEMQKKMLSYIEKNYSKNLTLEEIASSADISRSKGCIIFKKYLETSPIDYLNAYRLEKACLLLKTTDLSVSKIADICGFRHLSYFSKCFLDKYGVKPTHYRRQT